MSTTLKRKRIQNNFKVSTSIICLKLKWGYWIRNNESEINLMLTIITIKQYPHLIMNSPISVIYLNNESNKIWKLTILILLL